MAKEIKIEKPCDPRDPIIRQNNPNPYRDKAEEKLKNMIKEIEINGVKPVNKDIAEALPIGATVNGVTKAKELTHYEEKTEEQEQAETKKCLLTDECLLTKEQEEELKEKFIQEKTDEIMNAIKELSKGYMPKENIDVSKKISEEDMFEIARKIFGIEKQPSRLEKFKKFVQACQKAAEEREQDKKEYVAPECKIVEEGMIPGDFDGICRDLMALHARKNKDYGNAAHESYKEFGLISYVIRLNDKMKRLKSLTKPGVEQEVKSESIEDTLMDLAAYAIMAIESLRNS